jgi:hypothetical protein
MQTETTHSPTAAPAPAMLASGRHSDLNELPDVFLVELLLRHFFRLGELPLFQISQRLGLARQRAEALLRQMRDLHLVEVPRRGEFEGDVSYALTESGQLQAKLAFEKCHPARICEQSA